MSPDEYERVICCQKAALCEPAVAAQITNAGGFPKAAELIEITGAHLFTSAE
jgi:hypothetical protein